MHPTLVLQCFEWHFSDNIQPPLQVWHEQICYRDPEPGAKAAGDVWLPHCPTEQGTMAAQVSALRFHACSPCHGAGPGWL